jgi:hypothetical protein
MMTLNLRLTDSDIVKHPSLKDDRAWTFWQFNNRGRISGIDAYVDINVFHEDEAAFNAKFNKIRQERPALLLRSAGLYISQQYS